MNTYQRDGAMALGMAGAAPNYEPNSYSDAPKQAPQYGEPALALNGAAGRYDHREDTDYYSHARALFGLMSDEQKALLIDNIAGTMVSVSGDVIERQLEHFTKVDVAYGEGIRRALDVKRR
ncbi:Catalase [compost metagenome]